MLIGEGPGADEDTQGEPFVGRAGQLMNKAFIGLGIKRDNIVRHIYPQTICYEEKQYFDDFIDVKKEINLLDMIENSMSAEMQESLKNNTKIVIT